MKSTMKLIIAAVVVVALMSVPAMARSPDINTLQPTDVVFVYETGLNLGGLQASMATDSNSGTPVITSFVKFANDQPDPTVAGGGQQLATLPIDTTGTFSVYTSPAYLGIWYPYAPGYVFKNAAGTGTINSVDPKTYIQIQHADVALDAVLNASHINSIAGSSVTRATQIAFKLTSTYAGNYYKFTPTGATSPTYAALVNIQLVTPGGGTIQIFGNNNVDLRDIALVGSQEYTDTLVGQQDLYVPSAFSAAVDLTGVEAGTYTATAKWVNHDPATGLATPWYNLESNSNAVTFTVLSKPITITTNKETVVRGNSFVVTVTGESKYYYYVYLKDSSIGSQYTYPQIAEGQPYVYTTVPTSSDATAAGLLPNLNPAYIFPGMSSPEFIDLNPNVSTALAPNPGVTFNQTAAVIQTQADGTLPIQFDTLSTVPQTDDVKYTVKAVDSKDPTKYDTVDITVQKGTVTVTYEGTGTYYLGETIYLSGTNTDSDTVYLGLTGPNVNPTGSGEVSVADDSIASVDNNPATYKAVSVNTDNTWTYKWDTSSLGPVTLDAGTYTIYATAQPMTKNNLSNVQYATASVVLMKPFVTASVSANTVAEGDILYIQGTAEGNPTDVFVWIFGKNYRSCQNSAAVASDASYQYKLDRGDTQPLYAGQYFAIVQHPMMNGIADVIGSPTGPTCTQASINPASTTWTVGSPTVQLAGLQASDAATALTDLLNSPNIDDTYTKLSFMVEDPWIRLDTIGDHYVGDQIPITGTTNIAAGDQVQITVVSSSFQPTEKTQSGQFSGQSGTVPVVAGSPYNTFSFTVDASTFKPDEYLVTAESIQPSQTTTGTFNVLAGTPTTVSTTVPPTPAVTTAAPTVVPTTVATAVPTTTAKPQPGFGAAIALVGLGAVALLVLRRR